MKKKPIPKNSLFFQLAQSINRQTPFSELNKIFHPQVVIFMDKKKFVGISGWKKWIVEIHRITNKQKKTLQVCFETYQQEQNIYTIEGGWLINGKKHPQQAVVKYEVKTNKIQTIWTHKKNYTPIFGEKINSVLYFYFICCRIFLRTSVQFFCFKS